MALDFSKFDEQVNTAQLAKDAEEAKKNGGGFTEIPDGKYDTKIEKMEIAETKDGRPMFKAMFRILDGEHEKSCLFMNRVIFGTKNDASMIGSVMGFLEKLEACDEDGAPYICEFQSYSQLNDLVLDIAEAIEADGLGYTVDYKKDDFNSISIEEVFEL